MSNHAPANPDDMRAKFPKIKPRQIEGQPDLAGLLRMYSYLKRCAKSHRVPGTPLGLLWMAVRPAVWNIYSPTPYPAQTPDPGPNPVYANNAGQVAITRANNNWKLANKKRQDEEMMDQLLIEEFMGVIEGETYRARLELDLNCQANPTFLWLYNLAHTIWGQSDVEKMQRIKQNYTHHGQPEMV